MLVFKPHITDQIATPEEAVIVLELIKNEHTPTKSISEILVSISPLVITGFIAEICDVFEPTETPSLTTAFTHILDKERGTITEKFVQNFVVECDFPEIAKSALKVEPRLLKTSNEFTLDSIHKLLKKAKTVDQQQVFAKFMEVFYENTPVKIAIDKLDLWQIVTSENYNSNIEPIKILGFSRFYIGDQSPYSNMFDVHLDYSLEHIKRVFDLIESTKFHTKIQFRQFVEIIKKFPQKTPVFIEATKIIFPEEYFSRGEGTPDEAFREAASSLWGMFSVVSRDHHLQVYEIICGLQKICATNVQYGITEFAKTANTRDDETNLEKIKIFTNHLNRWTPFTGESIWKPYMTQLEYYISPEKMAVYRPFLG